MQSIQFQTDSAHALALASIYLVEVIPADQLLNDYNAHYPNIRPIEQVKLNETYATIFAPLGPALPFCFYLHPCRTATSLTEAKRPPTNDRPVL